MTCWCPWSITALAITGAELRFLMLRSAGGLEMRIARHRRGRHLHSSDLRVPREVIHRALETPAGTALHELRSPGRRRDAAAGERCGSRTAQRDLRPAGAHPNGPGRCPPVSFDPAAETVGVLYMDFARDCGRPGGGNANCFQTLAIEASTVLENARLLEEERAKRPMEED